MIEKDYYAAVDDYNRGILDGIVKIASKMGISTIQSYQGSQIFEALGIADEVINEYFTGTISWKTLKKRLIACIPRHLIHWGWEMI